MTGYCTSVDWRTWSPSVTDYKARQANLSNNKSVSVSQTDAYVSSSSETCTDGKDDGKIGFFSAVGNALKGIGKTIVNGVKGMFTDKDGKFSIGKTLLSIGTAALCIAVPAVGVAACAIGGTMGAIQVGKGIYNAANADTDAEAKEAWQNIGGGAFTVAASVVGAKAGIKAMKTAAGNTAKGSALQSLENAGTKLSAKTLGQYGKAFLQDGYRSGKYNLGQLKAGLASTTSALKNSNASSTVKEAVRHPFKTVNKAIHSDTASKAFNAAKHPIQSLKSIPSNLSSGAQAVLKAIQSTDSTYAQLVQKYGFESVAEVLELYGGYTIASENI